MLCVQNLRAQNEWAPIEAKWYYSKADNPFKMFYYESIKDSIVNGKTCKVVTRSIEEEYIMYSEDDKVYFLYNDQFYVLYNFDVNHNDTVTLTLKSMIKKNDNPYDTILSTDFIINKIDSIQVSGSNIKKVSGNFIIPDTIDSDLQWKMNSLTYFEYIGNTQYDFIPEILGPPHALGGGSIELRCYIDDEIHYTTDWWNNYDKPCDYRLSDKIRETDHKSIKVYYNSVDQIVAVHLYKTMNKNNLRAELYNIKGEIIVTKKLLSDRNTLLLTNSTKGVYLIKIFDQKTNQVYCQKKLLIQ